MPSTPRYAEAGASDASTLRGLARLDDRDLAPAELVQDGVARLEAVGA